MKLQTAPKSPQTPAALQHGGIRRGLLFAAGATAVAAGLYVLAGFYGAPWLMDRWLSAQAAAAPGGRILREAVRFDPLTLVAEVVALDARADGASLTADRLVVDFSARSLIELRPIVSSIVVLRPRIGAASVGDLPRLASLARGKVLNRMRIERLELMDGRLDAGLGTDLRLDWPRLDLSLTGFDPAAGAAGRFSLEAATAAEASVAADGLLAADLEHAEGQLRLAALELAPLMAALGARAGTRPAALLGSVGLRGELELTADFSATSLRTEPAVELSGATLALSQSSLTPAPGLTTTAAAATGSGDFRLTWAEDGIDVGGRLELAGRSLTVRDARAEPPQSFVFDTADLRVAIDGDRTLSLRLAGRPGGAGEAVVDVRVPPQAAAARRIALEAADLPAGVLSAYAGDALQRRLAAGRADLDLEYALGASGVEGVLQVEARDIELATRAPDRVGAAVAPAFSPELAAALLEDADGRIGIDLPFSAPAGLVRDAVSGALQARLAAMTARPFVALAPLLDGTAGTASAVRFLPGDAALDEQALAQLARLADALLARPRLGLRVHAGHDATADRNALARQQIELHVQLATAGPALQARPAPVDFRSARAQDVLDEFAGERLPAGRLAALAAGLGCDPAASPDCRETYYERVFAALVANEEITATALNRLGRFRALSIVDALRQQGVAEERLEIVTGGDAVETPFGIRLPLELTAAVAAR